MVDRSVAIFKCCCVSLACFFQKMILQYLMGLLMTPVASDSLSFFAQNLSKAVYAVSGSTVTMSAI